MRICYKIATALRRNRPRRFNVSAKVIQYVNRDHVVLASVSNNRLTLTTTSGQEIIIADRKAEMEEIIEQLVGSIGSNFVRISATEKDGGTNAR